MATAGRYVSCQNNVLPTAGHLQLGSCRADGAISHIPT